MAAGKQGEVAAAGPAEVGQEVLDLELQGPARLAHPDVAQRLAAVGVDEALVLGIGRTHDGLGHAELDVGPHQVEHGSEGGRMVDQVDEDLAVRQDVAPVHARARRFVPLAPDLLPVEPVDLPDERGDGRFREHTLEEQVAVAGPPGLLRGTQRAVSGHRKPPGSIAFAFAER